MFEREITDAMFLQRWGIVRTLMPQSVAEHTYAVAHYANDIAVYLGLPATVHLALLQYALWHDAKDEIFTSDLPGPNKRGLLDAVGPNAKEAWDERLNVWANRVFRKLEARMGGKLPVEDAATVKYALKTADWLEAAVRMATEAQMGNGCATRHIVPNRDGARDTVRRLIEHLYSVKIDPDDVPLAIETSGPVHRWLHLDQAILDCVENARNGQSRGPWITGEDDDRMFDPALGDRG